MTGDEDPLEGGSPPTLEFMQFYAAPSSSTSQRSHPFYLALEEPADFWNTSADEAFEEPPINKDDWMELHKDVFENRKQVMALNIDLIRGNLHLATTVKTVHPDLYDALVQSIDSLILYADVIIHSTEFYKMGGFEVLLPLLEVDNDYVKSKACQLIGDLVNNDSYCQKRALESNLLPQLFCLMEECPDDSVSLKALYAISCMCKNNTSILFHILEIDGLNKLLNVLQSPPERLRTKAAYFLTNLCNELPEVRDVLFDMDIVPLLARLLRQNFKPSHEYVASALLSLACHHERSRKECLNPELGLENCIKGHLHAIPNEAQWYDVRRYLNDLSAYCVPDNGQYSDDMAEDELER